MRMLTLQRLESSEEGTFGELVVGKVRFLTLENSDERVPAGVYQCVWEMSARFKRKLYELKGVPGRSECKFHPANLPRELEGCIALGRIRGSINGQKALLKSREAVTHFEQMLDGAPFTLKVLNWYSASQAQV